MMINRILASLALILAAFAAAPADARFYSTDPLGYEDQTNLYTYVGNDPVNKIDPNGEESASFAVGSDPLIITAREAAAIDAATKGIINFGLDNTPGVGDAKGIFEFAQNPTALGAVGVGLGLVGADALKGPLRQIEKLIPDKAVETLAHVRETGSAPDGYVGGRTFENREGKLPQNGNYKEYDVDPKPQSGSRNSERLVVDQDSGRAFYTPDHYDTFEEIDY